MLGHKKKHSHHPSGKGMSLTPLGIKRKLLQDESVIRCNTVFGWSVSPGERSLQSVDTDVEGCPAGTCGLVSLTLLK